MRLNKEQKLAVQMGKGPLLIIAGAGTGKTTVVTERIKHLIFSELAKPSEILALTFTQKAAREMQERIDIVMPYGYTQMWISTFHAFCDRILRAEALHIGLDPRFKLMTQAETIQFVRDNLFKFDLNYFRPLGNPTRFISGMIQHFSRLQDEDINPVQYFRWAKSQVTKAKRKPKEEKIEAAKWFELASAFKAYEQLKIKQGSMDFGDLIVKSLKLFRDRPNITSQYQKQFKYILVDEFQDTNFAQNELALLLASKSKNITVTGDDDQCLPASSQISTREGLRKIKNIKIGDEVVTAIGKGHTSISKVNRVFKNKRKAILLTLKTKSGKKITLTNNHKMFCFIPGHYRSKSWYYVYLMQKQSLGWRIGMTNNLSARLKLERQADKIIAIGSYKSEQEARFYELFYAAKYGLPTTPFSARPNQAVRGQWLERLFNEVDTEKRAQRLAYDLHIELDSPQFLVNAAVRGATRRIKVNLIMSHRNYRSKTHKKGFVGNPNISHMVQIETRDPKTLALLKEAGFRLNKAKKGKVFRFQSTDLKKAWEVADELIRVTGGILDKKFFVGRYNYQHLPARVVPASHIFPGMLIPVLKGKRVVYEEVISRKEKIREITTYDLEVERTHNFVADGVVVHNSIYRFRGAAVSNILQFKKHFPRAKVVTLIKNYRSGQEVLDKAYGLIQFNNPDRLEAKEKVNKKLVAQRKQAGKVKFIHVDRVENEAESVTKEIIKLTKSGNYQFKDVAVLVRANNHAEPFVNSFGRRGVPHQFLGPGKLFNQPGIIDLISYLKVIYDPDDSLFFYHLLSLDGFEINPRDLVKMGRHAKRHNVSLFEVSEGIDEIEVLPKTKEQVKEIVEIIKKHLKLAKKQTAGQLLYNFLEETNLLQDLLNPDSPTAEREVANISKFFNKLRSYEVDHEDATITAVVDWIELSSELGESPLAANTDWDEVNAVNILTAHSSKGLEFPIVFLVNMVSQRFPSNMRREQIPIPTELIKEILPEGDFHIQEERRLCYVGMTRARDYFYFTAANYYGEGKREKRLSPFITEALGVKGASNLNPKDISEQLSFIDYQKIDAKKSKLKKIKTKIDYLSYSQIATFQICPLHYKLRYILNIPTPISAAQSFGISIHETLKDFYILVESGKKPTSRLINKVLKDNWVGEGYSNKTHESKSIVRGKEYLSGFLKEGFNEKSQTLGLEQVFTFPLKSSSAGLRVGGKIDRVEKLRGGKIEVIDYKTGERIPTQKEVDSDLQLTLYALAASKIKESPFGRKPSDILLSLYFLSTQEKISTIRTAKQLIEAEKEILKVKKEIESSNFKCSRHFFCNNCEYSLLCNQES